MEKKKKPTKKIPTKITENQFGSVLEDINSKLDLVLESYDTLDKKVDRLHLEAKEDLSDFKVETRRNFKQIFEFQDRADANFKVTLEYLSRLDDEIQILKEELKGRPALMAIFEDRMKKMEKDLILCKKALAI